MKPNLKLRVKDLKFRSWRIYLIKPVLENYENSQKNCKIIFEKLPVDYNESYQAKIKFRFSNVDSVDNGTNLSL